MPAGVVQSKSEALRTRGVEDYVLVWILRFKNQDCGGQIDVLAQAFKQEWLNPFFFSLFVPFWIE